MDRKDMDFARSWARRYVRTKHPYGLDEGDVQNRILESLYYNKDKEKALSKALNAVQNESRRNLRALCLGRCATRNRTLRRRHTATSPERTTLGVHAYKVERLKKFHDNKKGD